MSKLIAIETCESIDEVGAARQQRQRRQVEPEQVSPDARWPGRPGRHLAVRIAWNFAAIVQKEKFNYVLKVAIVDYKFWLKVKITD